MQTRSEKMMKADKRDHKGPPSWISSVNLLSHLETLREKAILTQTDGSKDKLNESISGGDADVITGGGVRIGR